MIKDKKLPIMTRAPINYATILRKGRIKEASLQYRHDVAKSRQRQNYINEYDRIKGMLSHNITHEHYDYQRLKNRQTEL
jgi:hypothetical protein